MKPAVKLKSPTQLRFVLLAAALVFFAAIFFHRLNGQKFTTGLCVSGGIFTLIIYAWFELKHRLTDGRKPTTGLDSFFYLIISVSFVLLILNYSVVPTIIASCIVFVALIFAIAITGFASLQEKDPKDNTEKTNDGNQQALSS
jgi:hypothetical protein